MSVYLDYAATTPVDEAVLAAMLPWLGQDYANAASSHAPGQRAAQAIEQARAQVATLIGAQPREIILTSGATESNNLAIQGATRFVSARAGSDKGHIISVKTEHKSVVDVCRQLEREGWRVSMLRPQADGRISAEQIAAEIRDDTVLVSLMWVNNETGVMQDIASVAALTRTHGVLLHVDATQAVGRVPVDMGAVDVDLLSLSAHKIYGPKGVGALYVRQRPRARIAPLILGGGHERGLRSGTLATHQVVGLGQACELAGQYMHTDNTRIGQMSEQLWADLNDLPLVTRNGAVAHVVPHILNLSFDGVDGEALLADVTHGEGAVYCATGSACTSTDAEPSYVLRAMGIDNDMARASLRFSIGRMTTQDDIDKAVTRVRHSVNRLRALSPLWQHTGCEQPQRVSA